MNENLYIAGYNTNMEPTTAYQKNSGYGYPDYEKLFLYPLFKIDIFLSLSLS